MKPIADFTECCQGQALADRFGDYDMDEMSNEGQAALLLILAAFIFHQAKGTPMPLYSEETDDNCYYEYLPPVSRSARDELNQAVELLEDITADNAIAIIAFLSQGGQ